MNTSVCEFASAKFQLLLHALNTHIRDKNVLPQCFFAYNILESGSVGSNLCIKVSHENLNIMDGYSIQCGIHLIIKSSMSSSEADSVGA